MVVERPSAVYLAIEVESAFRGADVVAVLDELTATRGTSVHIRSDNGPGLVSMVVHSWCAHEGTGTLFIELGAPWQNGIVESFNGRLRDELLSSETF